MSSYWAGYAVTGLILTQPEFDVMVRKYKEKNPKQDDIEEIIKPGLWVCCAYSPVKSPKGRVWRLSSHIKWQNGQCAGI